MANDILGIVTAMGSRPGSIPSDTVVSTAMGGRAPNLIANTTNVFDGTASAGSVITALSDPFAGAGLGTTTYSVLGSGSTQVALSGTNIVIGTGAIRSGSRYMIDIQAASGTGGLKVAQALQFRAQGASA